MIHGLTGMQSGNPNANDAAGHSVSGIQAWIIDRIAEELRVDRTTIKVDEPIMGLGIDSVKLVTILTQLEDWSGIRFDGNPLDQASTVEELAQHVVDVKQQHPSACIVQSLKQPTPL